MGGIVRVRRENSPWANRGRKFRILIDGVEVGRVGNRETVELPVPTGEFTIEARIDWVGSQTLQADVEEGDVVSFTVGNGDLLALIGRTDRYLTLNHG